MSQAQAPRRGFAGRIGRWLVLFVVIGTVVGIWQRERLWIWYCAERLELASDEDRGQWGDELAACGEPAIPSMLRLLRHDDAGVCAAAKGSLQNVVANWPK